MLQLLLLMISRFVEFATQKIGSAYRTSRRTLGSAVISTLQRSGTTLATVSAKLYRAVDRVAKQIEIGSLVRIRRKGWYDPNAGDVGVALARTYTTYESRYNRWRVMVGDENRIVHEGNLFLCEETG